MRVLRGLVLIAVGAAMSSPLVAEDVDRLAALDARANRPAEPWQPREDLAALPAANLLFSMTAPDNAVCIRGVNDVTDDGRPEVMVGIDESGVPNVFCLDGASRGAASVVWSHQTATGVSGGSPYGDQSVEIAADSDGNGFDNVLVGTAWGGRTAYSFDSLDGTVLWKLDTYLEPESGWVYSLAGLNDVTGDMVPDIVFGAGSFNDTLYVVDGASGGGLGSQATVVWSSYVGDAVYSVRDLGDVNGDGKHDVLAAVGDDVDVLYCFSGGSSPPLGDVLWSYTPGVSLYACGVLPDVTGDGVDEALAVLWTTGGSSIRCRNGVNGAQVWNSTTVGDYGMMVDVLADVTGDGKAEVVVSSWENAVIVLSGADGSQVWKTTVGTLNGGDVWTARAIDDLDGDGFQDVIAGSFDYHVYAMNGVDGEIIGTFDTGNRVYSVAPLGDLDDDGVAEVGVATQDTTSSTVVWVVGWYQPLFADGFEDGSTGAWSFVEP
jgi:hypothetical protein